MALKHTERTENVRVVDEFDGGVGWIAHPAEEMQRASHALVDDGEVYLVDPVDAADLDDVLADRGEVAGVVVLMSNHLRDADAIARRHDASVHLPSFFDGVARRVDAPVERFDDELADTGYRSVGVANNRLWREAALYDDPSGTLVVPEAVGTASYYLTPDERLGVNPVLRPVPPRAALGRFTPERVLVGHGEGVFDDAAAALADALSGARRRLPRLYARNVRMLLPT